MLMSTDTPRGRLPNETTLGRTALTCRDKPMLVEFYTEILGFDIVTTSQDATELGVSGTPILVLKEDTSKPPRKETETGLYHNAFRVPSRGALGDVLERIEAKWELTGASDHRVSEALYLDDPEGNGIEVYRDFPRETWPVHSNGRIDIGTEPLDLNTIRAAATGREQLPAGSDLGHIHLEVSSMNATRSFYVRTLGFDIMMEIPSALFLAAGRYHHHIGANTWQHRSRSLQGQGLRWFEILIPDDESLAALERRVINQDLKVETRESGIEVIDPDGIPVRVRQAGV